MKSNGNWLIGDSGQSTNGNDQYPDKQMSMAEVDAIADHLAREFDNLAYRKWYCKAIYTFGAYQINEWYERSKTGKLPGNLFSHYLEEAFEQRRIEEAESEEALKHTAVPEESESYKVHLDTAGTAEIEKPDIVYDPSNESSDKELSKSMDETLRLMDVEKQDTDHGGRDISK